MEAIAQKSGTQLVHIPYGSSPQAMTAVMRGDVQMAVMPAISVTPHVASGAVKILAVTTAKRSPFLPDVPTLKESGIDVEADAWNGMIAPAARPTPCWPRFIARWSRRSGARDKAKFASNSWSRSELAGRIPRLHRQRAHALDAVVKARTSR